MKKSHAFTVVAMLVVAGFSSPTPAYTGDDPVFATGVAACAFSDVQAHIGPSGAVTYKIYGSCAGSTVSGQVGYSNGKFQESFVVSNYGKINTVGYCDTDPWATAANCHDQQVQSSAIPFDPGLLNSAPLSLYSGGGYIFHQAFLNASRPNPPGIPVNLASTYALGRVTATWLAPDASGDRPFLGFLMQVRPQNAEGAAWTDIGTIAWHATLDYRLSGKTPVYAVVPAWDVRVCSTTALTMTCSPAQAPNGAEQVTEINTDHSAAEAAILSVQTAPTVAFARVKTTGPMPAICDAAASARARNSPAAPGLERQCAAQQGMATSAYSSATETTNDHSAEAALLQSNAPKALGRVTATTVPGSTGIGTKTFCEMAADARAAQRPTAAALQQRCDAENAAKAAVATPAPAPSGRYPPVLAPHDLIIGRISFSQDGQAVDQVVMGSQVTIACNYIVNVDSRALSFVREWRGSVQTGGQVPQTMEFPGSTDTGSHEARVYWTPSVTGSTPVSCALNPGFENSEADGGNNRINVTIDVVSGDEPAPPAAEDAPPPPVENN